MDLLLTFLSAAKYLLRLLCLKLIVRIIEFGLCYSILFEQFIVFRVLEAPSPPLVDL